MEAAVISSRRKIWSKVCFTVEVPAPEEPTTETLEIGTGQPASRTARRWGRILAKASSAS